VLPTVYFNAETLVVIISACFAFGHRRSPEACNRKLDEKPTLKVCLDDDFDCARVILWENNSALPTRIVAPGADNRSYFIDIQPADLWGIWRRWPALGRYVFDKKAGTFCRKKPAECAFKCEIMKLSLVRDGKDCPQPPEIHICCSDIMMLRHCQFSDIS
jgi:hypothetical protein